jgi:lipoate-protein ligase B
MRAESVWLGTVPYASAIHLQERVRAEVVEGKSPETLLLLQHDPVITLGRSADPSHVLWATEDLRERGIAVVRTSRGGDVTFHGPGQLVGYPIFRLENGVRAHVRAMAEGIVAVLSRFGISSQWRESHPGVWVGADKICALGVHVRHRVAIHGFALNGSTDLDGFRMIVPCGLHSFGVTSLERLLGSSPPAESLAEEIRRAFELSFHKEIEPIPAERSRLQIAIGNL